ncbi:hypothetical protein HPB48_023190 [Haemaphysalis longicornis]|uniref:Uncharacterized protein n=1 Tax=Haemaphysalis longicornis TaxID=44386 RepID=A0A9J6H4M0_HAELO|nr:hypothetical protein HPB48_023190 [Haemaphysalis longicornis]
MKRHACPEHTRRADHRPPVDHREPESCCWTFRARPGSCCNTSCSSTSASRGQLATIASSRASSSATATRSAWLMASYKLRDAPELIAAPDCLQASGRGDGLVHGVHRCSVGERSGVLWPVQYAARHFTLQSGLPHTTFDRLLVALKSFAQHGSPGPKTEQEARQYFKHARAGVLGYEMIASHTDYLIFGVLIDNNVVHKGWQVHSSISGRKCGLSVETYPLFVPSQMSERLLEVFVRLSSRACARTTG